ncbi:hypothetical protein QCH26_004799, partial [Salmonella enterica subsp. enterica serovar Kentucky]|nr:hypothetical protein [Salmonella enterica subsp. enterica serovar Kentucky]
MNNDELATRRAQAIAEDRCFSKERLRDEFLTAWPVYRNHLRYPDV